MHPAPVEALLAARLAHPRAFRLGLLAPQRPRLLRLPRRFRPPSPQRHLSQWAGHNPGPSLARPRQALRLPLRPLPRLALHLGLPMQRPRLRPLPSLRPLRKHRLRKPFLRVR